MLKAALGVPVALSAARPATAEPWEAVVARGNVPTALIPFDTTMKKYMYERGITAGQLAVARKGKLVFTRAYTLSTPARPMPAVTPTSLFRIASLSKHITATAILRLAQEAKLNLGTPVTGLLDLKPDGRKAGGRSPVGRLFISSVIVSSVSQPNAPRLICSATVPSTYSLTMDPSGRFVGIQAYCPPTARQHCAIRLSTLLGEVTLKVDMTELVNRTDLAQDAAVFVGVLQKCHQVTGDVTPHGQVSSRYHEVRPDC
ncbi:serine hydrolase domain-containing protein [Nonomuraea sp. NPDC046802]|uniref:serine hydrolase domain-containing protein n=1 Tax=Nonomuraea sp. NPDC046802 TaxID=3154919 RepID=UPI00340B6529